MSETNDKSLRLQHQLEQALKPMEEKLESLEKEMTLLRKEQEKLNQKLNN